MKNIALSQLYFNEWKVDFDLISDSVFNGIEFRADRLLSQDDWDIAEKIRKKLDKSKISSISMHAPFAQTDISVQDDWFRTKSIREIEKSCALLFGIGGKYLVVHPSMKNDGKYSRSMEMVIKSLSEIRETAEHFNLEIAVENTLPGRIGSTEEEIRIIKSEGFSLCFDIGHANLTSINPEAFFKEHKSSIKVLHLHENDGVSDKHMMPETAECRRLIKKLIAETSENVVAVFEIFDYGMSVSEVSEIARGLI